MIELSLVGGRRISFAPSAIASVDDAPIVRAWHGARAIVRTWDGRTVEVCERPEHIRQMMGERHGR